MNRENERTISGNQCDDATLDTGDVRGGGGGREGRSWHACIVEGACGGCGACDAAGDKQPCAGW